MFSNVLLFFFCLQQGPRSLSPDGGNSDGTDSQEQRIQRLQELLVLKVNTKYLL